MLNPRTLEDGSQRVVAEADAPIVKQAPEVRRPSKPTTFFIPESRAAFFIFVFIMASFLLLRALTSQAIVIGLATLNIAIIGMWVWAFLSRTRSLTRSSDYKQQE
jgi:hypothetical protein